LQLFENKAFEKNEKNEQGFSKIPQNIILFFSCPLLKGTIRQLAEEGFKEMPRSTR